MKLENLQLIGAFKARPMGNVLLKADHATLQNGVITSGSGIAGLGLAWIAIAIPHGWRTLVTPRIMCGIFGYVFGTFISITVTAFLC